MKFMCCALLITLLSGCQAGYIVKNGEVVFSWPTENGRHGKTVQGADAASFEQLAEWEYGKDKRCVYWRGDLIAGADPQTFELLGHLYSRDRHQVFWQEKPIPGADRDTFVILDGPRLWSRDAGDVFFADEAIGVKDPKNFRVLDKTGASGGHWATDGVAYYNVSQYKAKGILPSDYATTRLLNEAYAVDKRQAYFRTQPIANSDPSTFSALNELYAVDASHAYFEGARIEGADRATFRQEGHWNMARDRFRTYEFGKPK